MATLIELFNCLQVEYLTIIAINMTISSVVTYQWGVLHSLEFGTWRLYQNYNNNVIGILRTTCHVITDISANH